jgi:tetratricopeptide (TPR) repeat protein
MATRAKLIALLTLALATAAVGIARADEQSDVAKARAAYEAKNYDDAERRLRAMLDPDKGTLTDPALRTQARMYWGATLLALKRREEATQLFEKLLLDDPSFEADPLSFPSDVVDAFIDTRKRIIDKVNAAKAEQARLAADRRAREDAERRRAAERLRLLEKMATEEKITERHSRWIALIPFGVGQFQNGQRVLGGIFMTSEIAFLVVGAAAVPFYVYNRGRVYDYIGRDPNTDPVKTYRERANTAYFVSTGFDTAFLVTAAIGAVHAEITFVPETAEVKKRPLPTVGLSPVIAPTFLGVEGHF